MKLPLLHSHGGRRAFFLRYLWPHSQSPTNNTGTEATHGVADSTGPTKLSSNQSVPAMWLLRHALFCVISIALGFRLSRLLLFLLFLPSPPISPTARVGPPVILPSPLLPNTTITSTSSISNSSISEVSIGGVHHGSHVYVGRHPIRVRAFPHPEPAELMRAHRILDAVQREQRRLSHRQAGPIRDILAVTPTFASATQAARLTSLAHTLRLAQFPVIWIVIEAGKMSDETAAFLARSGMQFVHLGFGETNVVPPPDNWVRKRVLESRMRVAALKEIREQRMDGIVVFVDESNVHRMELFDEVQKVKWIGALPVSFLDHPEMGDNVGIPAVQGPACDASGQFFGFHAFDSLIYVNKSKRFVADGKLEWAGFALSSQLLWKGPEDLPAWVRDLNAVDEKGAETGSPLVLVKDASMVEPLGDCSKKALLWWLRSDNLLDTKFPPGWRIDLSLVKSIPTEHNASAETLQNQSTAVSIEQDRD